MACEQCRPQLPRPWYISLTAVWREGSKSDSELRKVVAPYLLRRAGHHLLVPLRSWHFTVLAIMQFNGHPKAQNMRDFARSVFSTLRSKKKLLTDLQSEFLPFNADAYEIRCYDDALALQFHCGKELGRFRNHARDLLSEPVAELTTWHKNSVDGQLFRVDSRVELVESILYDRNKNFDTRAYGSIARSPCPSDDSIERWRESLDGPSLEFNKIHLLVSDEMLTNRRHKDIDCVSIEPRNKRRIPKANRGRSRKR